MPLLQVKNLTKNYKTSTGLFKRSLIINANQNISLELEQGKTLAIVGESGSGKSTLARQIIGIEQPTSGTVWLNDQALRFKNRRERKKRFTHIRMIFQNPFESLNPNIRIGHSLDQTLIINTKLSSKQRKKKISDTLIKVGLQHEHQFRYPYMFSGGQRQRVAIARAIILEPSIIIADEPLSALDVSIQAQILNLLQSLQETMGISYIFISHDLNVVEHIADSVIVMYQGQVVEQGDIAQIFDQPQHPYTQALFSSSAIYHKRFPDFLPQGARKGIIQTDSMCVFANRCQYCESRCQKEKPNLTQLQHGHQIACFKSA